MRPVEGISAVRSQAQDRQVLNDLSLRSASRPGGGAGGFTRVGTGTHLPVPPPADPQPLAPGRLILHSPRHLSGQPACQHGKYQRHIRIVRVFEKYAACRREYIPCLEEPRTKILRGAIVQARQGEGKPRRVSMRTAREQAAGAQERRCGGGEGAHRAHAPGIPAL